MIPLDKISARKAGLAARAALSLEQRQRYDSSIADQAIALIRFYGVIGCYVSMRDEAGTEAILDWCFASGKTVAVPKTAGGTLEFHEIHSRRDLVPGHFGVLEPAGGRMIEPEQIEMMLVPLSAFDAAGNRTGYGKGYYDSILKRCPRKAGLAYPQQQVEQIDADPWDVRLDQVIIAKD